MAYTEYLFDVPKIRKELTKKKASLKRNTGRTDFVAHAVEVIAERLARNPQRYLDYGPYWPALKSILLANRAIHGSEIEPEIASVYRGDSDEMTVMMAEVFRDFNLAHYLLYTRSWQLDGDSAEEWILEDRDIEITDL